MQFWQVKKRFFFTFHTHGTRTMSDPQTPTKIQEDTTPDPQTNDTLRQQKSRWIDAPSHPCLYYCCLGAQDEDGCSGDPSFYYLCHPCPTAYWRAVKCQDGRFTYFHNATTDEKTWTRPAVFIDLDGKKVVVGTIWVREEDGEPMSAFEKAIACAQRCFVLSFLCPFFCLWCCLCGGGCGGGGSGGGGGG